MAEVQFGIGLNYFTPPYLVGKQRSLSMAFTEPTAESWVGGDFKSAPVASPTMSLGYHFPVKAGFHLVGEYAARHTETRFERTRVHSSADRAASGKEQLLMVDQRQEYLLGLKLRMIHLEICILSGRQFRSKEHRAGGSYLVHDIDEIGAPLRGGGYMLPEHSLSRLKIAADIHQLSFLFQLNRIYAVQAGLQAVSAIAGHLEEKSTRMELVGGNKLLMVKIFSDGGTSQVDYKSKLYTLALHYSITSSLRLSTGAGTTIETIAFRNYISTYSYRFIGSSLAGSELSNQSSLSYFPTKNQVSLFALYGLPSSHTHSNIFFAITLHN